MAGAATKKDQSCAPAIERHSQQKMAQKKAASLSGGLASIEVWIIVLIILVRIAGRIACLPVTTRR